MPTPENSGTDSTKEILEQILAQLYADQAKQPVAGEALLVADDGQMLGKVTSDRYDNDSILNEYSPYGSKYSPTSIFNPYSEYGSPYGQFSVNNPYTSTPPRLIVSGSEVIRVSANSIIPDRITPEAFIYALNYDIEKLLRGEPIESEAEVRRSSRQSYIQAEDGQFLGKLNPNRYDSESIFNKYGLYGSKYSTTCIFNKYATYGNQFSAYSPFNKFTTTPPKLYLKGEFAAHLTVNANLSPRVDPNDLLEWAERHVSKYST